MKDTAELFASLDALKARLDAHRPLPADIVSQIRQDMRIRFTYHSNAIEGNTLTMSETKAVLEDGITIGGKSLKEHLEAVGHSHAIDYMEALVQKDEALTERTLKESLNLILQHRRCQCRDIPQDECAYLRCRHIPPPAGRARKDGSLFPVVRCGAGALHPVEFAARVHADFVNIHPSRMGMAERSGSS
ncbi:MAG: Fic family protein [Bilophila wadsworthia]